jgi:hypothetical protein
MTGWELKTILDTYDKPPTHSNKSGVFVLYTRITGKRADRNCLNCAIECFLEMKKIALDFGEKEITLYKPNQRVMANNKELTKYRVIKPFRAFGSAKINTNENTTDAEVEAMINLNPALKCHFEFFNYSVKTLAEEVMPEVMEVDYSVSDESEIVEYKPKKRGRKRRLVETNG